MADKITGWVESVYTLSGVSCKHPQPAYAGLQKSLHPELAFMQRVNPGIRDAFGSVEKALPLGHTGCMGHRGQVRPLLAQQGGPDPGAPLAVIVYGIRVIPLIRELRGVRPRVTHPWYTDDAGAGRKSKHILAHLW